MDFIRLFFDVPDVFCLRLFVFHTFFVAMQYDIFICKPIRNFLFRAHEDRLWYVPNLFDGSMGVQSFCNLDNSFFPHAVDNQVSSGFT